jgi:hypothetical protein
VKRLAILIVLFATTAHADPAEPPSLFAKEADVLVEAPGLQRLELPADVLKACADDLADLRLVGPNGEVVPYLVDGGRGLEVRRTWAPSEVRVIDRLRQADRDVVGLRWTEILEIPAPPPAPDGVAERWTLTVRTDSRDFVRFIQVETRIGRRELTLLPEGATVHRYAGGRERLTVELPPLGQAPLRITLSGNDPGWLRPSFEMQAREALAGGEEIEVLLSKGSVRSADGRTVIELDRPGGLAIGALRLRTSTPTYDRPVVVWDEGADRSPGVLGRGAVFAVQGSSPLIHDRVTVRRPRGDRLRLVIDDGDSPPLADLAVYGILRRPALLFTATQTATPYILRFGGDRVRRPRYDLQSLLPARSLDTDRDERARAAVRLFGEAVPARLGPIRPNPVYDDGPILAFAMRAGAELRPSDWSSRRTLKLPGGGDGPARVRLEPADMAVLRPDLGDVRIVDAQNRQWPYLVERGHQAELPVTFEQAAEDGSTTLTLTDRKSTRLNSSHARTSRMPSSA